MRWPRKHTSPIAQEDAAPEVVAPSVAAPVIAPVAAAALHGVDSPAPVVEPGAPPAKNLPVARAGRKTGARVAWVISMASIGAAVGGVIILGMKFIDGPVQGTTTQTVLSAMASTSPTPGINQLTGLRIELAYPGVFDQVSQIKNDAQSVEQYNIGSRRESARMIAVSVRNLPGGKLDDESGYRFRSINPQDYKLTTSIIGKEAVAIMTKRDKTEATLFWPHAQMVAVVSITSTSSKDDVSAFLATVMKDMRWRQ